MDATSSPLDGMLVADFSRVLAGPLATMTWPTSGATVVKVERPGAGDETRGWGPPWTDETSSYFECVNRGKHSVALDLADPADRSVAARTRAPGRRRRARTSCAGPWPASGSTTPPWPQAIPASSTARSAGFGSGAGADRPGYDFLVQAVGGLMSITGDPDGEPTKVGVALVDVLTGKDAVIGILAALRARERTGRGRARRGRPAVQPARRAGQPGRRVPRHRRRRDADGQPAPVDRAVRDAAVRGRSAGRGVRQRRAVPPAGDVLGRPELADDTGSPPTPRACSTAPRSCRRSRRAGERHRPRGGSSGCTAAGVPAGLVGDIGSAIDARTGSGSTRSSTSAKGASRRCGTRSGTRPTRSRRAAAPPRLGEHTEQIRRLLDDNAPVPPRRAT